MHKVVKAGLLLAVSLAAVGLGTIHDHSRVDRQVTKMKKARPADDALALPQGEVSAGVNDRFADDRMGEAGGAILLTGQSVPGGVRLTWHLGGMAAPDGIELARSTHVLPSVNKDEKVEAPAGSSSFLWKTSPGTWHFRACLPEAEAADGACRLHSNDVQVEVYPSTDGASAAPAMPPPDEGVVADWAANKGPLALEVTPRPEGFLLSWTAATSAGFKRYRVVRSETNSQPSWPADGFLTSIADIGFSKYIDRAAEAGVTYYYRVCAERADGSSSCGNPVVARK